MDASTSQQRKFIYYRKNYLFGIARPGALVFDGTSLSCYDNALQSVFNIPLGSLTVKEGSASLKYFNLVSASVS